MGDGVAGGGAAKSSVEGKEVAAARTALERRKLRRLRGESMVFMPRMVRDSIQHRLVNRMSRSQPGWMCFEGDSGIVSLKRAGKSSPRQDGRFGAIRICAAAGGGTVAAVVADRRYTSSAGLVDRYWSGDWDQSTVGIDDRAGAGGGFDVSVECSGFAVGEPSALSAGTIVVSGVVPSMGYDEAAVALGVACAGGMGSGGRDCCTGVATDTAAGVGAYAGPSAP